MLKCLGIQCIKVHQLESSRQKRKPQCCQNIKKPIARASTFESHRPICSRSSRYLCKYTDPPPKYKYKSIDVSRLGHTARWVELDSLGRSKLKSNSSLRLIRLSTAKTPTEAAPMTPASWPTGGQLRQAKERASCAAGGVPTFGADLKLTRAHQMRDRGVLGPAFPILRVPQTFIFGRNLFISFTKMSMVRKFQHENLSINDLATKLTKFPPLPEIRRFEGSYQSDSPLIEVRSAVTITTKPPISIGSNSLRTPAPTHIKYCHSILEASPCLPAATLFTAPLSSPSTPSLDTAAEHMQRSRGKEGRTSPVNARAPPITKERTEINDNFVFACGSRTS